MIHLVSPNICWIARLCGTWTTQYNYWFDSEPQKHSILACWSQICRFLLENVAGTFTHFIVSQKYCTKLSPKPLINFRIGVGLRSSLPRSLIRPIKYISSLIAILSKKYKFPTKKFATAFLWFTFMSLGIEGEKDFLGKWMVGKF